MSESVIRTNKLTLRPLYMSDFPQRNFASKGTQWDYLRYMDNGAQRLGARDGAAKGAVKIINWAAISFNHALPKRALTVWLRENENSVIDRISREVGLNSESAFVVQLSFWVSNCGEQTQIVTAKVNTYDDNYVFQPPTARLIGVIRSVNNLNEIFPDGIGLAEKSHAPLSTKRCEMYRWGYYLGRVNMAAVERENRDNEQRHHQRIVNQNWGRFGT